MPRNKVKPIFVVSMIIVFISLGCGGTSQVATSTPVTPKPSPTLVPSYTPYPTYTPRPTPTRRPTDTPLPSATSLYQLRPTEVITSTAPINCVPGTNIGYNTCIDNSGMLQVDVPNTWPEVNGSTWTYDDHDIGVAISAAPNLAEFQSTFKAEGVFFGASGTFAQIYGHIELLDFYTMAYRENCAYIGRYNYDDRVYRGKYDYYENCGGNDGYDAYILGARDIADPSTKLILIEIQALPGDISIRDQIWNTFFVYF
ncbi:MAG TPA: hypothetical protein VLD65_08100 [Anaerolineales bacterium]|nr:hypothetical protein [Anaerolineales bacterium]